MLRWCTVPPEQTLPSPPPPPFDLVSRICNNSYSMRIAHPLNLTLWVKGKKYSTVVSGFVPFLASTLVRLFTVQSILNYCTHSIAQMVPIAVASVIDTAGSYLDSKKEGSIIGIVDPPVTHFEFE
jgi:hypothetical protein